MPSHVGCILRRRAAGASWGPPPPNSRPRSDRRPNRQPRRKWSTFPESLDSNERKVHISLNVDPFGLLVGQLVGPAIVTWPIGRVWHPMNRSSIYSCTDRGAHYLEQKFNDKTRNIFFSLKNWRKKHTIYGLQWKSYLILLTYFNWNFVYLAKLNHT